MIECWADMRCGCRDGELSLVFGQRNVHTVAAMIEAQASPSLGGGACACEYLDAAIVLGVWVGWCRQSADRVQMQKDGFRWCESDVRLVLVLGGGQDQRGRMFDVGI
jgi:hypothetical protein